MGKSRGSKVISTTFARFVHGSCFGAHDLEQFQHAVLWGRAAIAPFLAAKEMGLDSFKWVLYGDDDTVFFIDGALDALQNLDYNMPYLLSDDVWFVEDDGKHIKCLPVFVEECWSNIFAGMLFMFNAVWAYSACC